MPSSANWPCAALSRADLAPRTTVRVGGRAEWLLEPTTPGELEAAWCEARDRGYRPRILGGGANLLIADGDHPWVVITTERMNRLFRVGEHEVDDEAILTCASGTSTPVEIRLGIVRRIEVHDNVNTIDVESTSGNVRGHENLDVALGEPFQGLLPLALGQVTVNRRSIYVKFSKISR